MSFDTKRRTSLVHSIQNLDANRFEALALDVFQYQAQYNSIYRQYLDFLGILPKKIKSLDAIPFLPIALFKNHLIQTGTWKAETIFRSSGTTGMTRSQHLIRQLSLYQTITQIGFEQHYGALDKYCMLALLPSYLERQDSSLVYMVQHFLNISQHPLGGFFLDNLLDLKSALATCQKQGIPCLLIGVSFALLDFAEQFPMDLSAISIMETGGMKGRRKELTRKELHQQLQTAFSCPTIHSEYGMTELLSQAYSKGNGIFAPIATIRVRTREINDPLCPQQLGKTGGINVIDLANIDSCAFIATEDIGRVYADGSFEILGRLDASDMRGCNLMVAEM